MQFVLVRHADAERGSAWAGPDETRPLTRTGRAQADKLAVVLTDRRPERLLSSPRRRCIETLEPLATTLGLEIEIDDRLDERADGEALCDLFDECNGVSVVAATHGDVIPELLGILRARRGMNITEPMGWPTASSWVVRRSPDGDPVRAKFVPPPVTAAR